MDNLDYRHPFKIFLVFALQRSLRESASRFAYAYMACLYVLLKEYVCLEFSTNRDARRRMELALRPDWMFKILLADWISLPGNGTFARTFLSLNTLSKLSLFFIVCSAELSSNMKFHPSPRNSEASHTGSTPGKGFPEM